MTTTEQHDASLDSVKKKLPQAKAAASQRQRTASNPKQNVPPKPAFPQYQVSGQGTSDGANQYLPLLVYYTLYRYFGYSSNVISNGIVVA